MNKLLKYKYYILFFIILELCLFTYLTIEKQNKIQTYIDKQSSIIVTNYNTIQSIYKKASNINLNTIEIFKQLKIEMEKFLDVDIYFLIDKKYIQNSKKIYIKSRENPNY